MFKFWSIKLPYRFPEENEAPEIDPAAPETDLGILADDEEPAEVEEEEDTEDDTEDEENKEDNDEAEAEEEELARVSLSQIKAKYPDFFKEFPQLKAAFFREQEYSRIFPDVKSAEAAAEGALLYEDLKDVVLKGNVEKILTDIKSVSEASLKKFAGNFLPTLNKLDKDTYIQVTAPIIQNVIKSVIAEGARIKDDKLQEAAKLVNEIIFGDKEYKQPEPKEKDEELDKEREEFLKTKHNDLLTSVIAVTDKELVKEIGEIDPTGLLKDKPKLKAKIQKEIVEAVKDALHKDEAHMRNMGSLLEREKRSGYKGQLKDSIITAFLSRAKALVPKIRREIRAEYLGNVKDVDTRVAAKANGRTNNLPIGSESRKAGAKVTVADARKEKMTDRGIIDA
jgi:hypothetical protein